METKFFYEETGFRNWTDQAELNLLKGRREHSFCLNYQRCLNGENKKNHSYGNPRNGNVCGNFKNKYWFEVSTRMIS